MKVTCLSLTQGYIKAASPVDNGSCKTDIQAANGQRHYDYQIHYTAVLSTCKTVTPLSL